MYHRISMNRNCATIVASLLAVMLNGCTSGNIRSESLKLTAASCAELAKMRIPASDIGLPTTGGVITETKMIAASGTGASAIGDYCLVSGNILPVDPTAPNIKFQVALPAVWNSKVLMMGGGGFDGSIPNVAGNVANTTAISPLGRGYVVFASDSGHQASPIDGSFALNKEAYGNWIGDALKKTRDSAFVLVKVTYGSTPTRSYFLGGSTGGRESLAAVSRWPADWDGNVVLYPGRDVTAQILVMLAEARALAVPGAFPNFAKRDILHSAALAACDALDGLTDGVISNVQGCNATFNPSTALLHGVPVRCPGGADTGDTCLSDAQLFALKKINGPVRINFSHASGVTSVPGYNVFISDNNGPPSTSPFQITIAAMALGNVPPAFPIAGNMSFATQLADNFIRYAIARDPKFNSLTVDPSNPGVLASRLREFSALDAPDRDLTPFAAKGGKVLIMHGTEDTLVSPRRTELYVQQLKAKMGTDKVDSFLRFFEVPGFGHSISAQFNAAWDQLTALENWVENDVDPAMNQIVTDTVGIPGRTRPLCVYPTWPKYKGSGDVNSATSFTCVAN